MPAPQSARHGSFSRPCAEVEVLRSWLPAQSGAVDPVVRFVNVMPGSASLNLMSDGRQACSRSWCSSRCHHTEPLQTTMSCARFGAVISQPTSHRAESLCATVDAAH